MYSYIPIIDLELIEKDKITITIVNNKITVLYDYDDGCDKAELNIKLSATKIGLGFNKDSLHLYSQLLYELREFIDELYKAQLTEDEKGILLNDWSSAFDSSVDSLEETTWVGTKAYCDDEIK